MTRLQLCFLVAGVLWVLIVVFALLGAGWNKENDEAGRRLFDRDNENPEDHE